MDTSMNRPKPASKALGCETVRPTSWVNQGANNARTVNADPANTMGAEKTIDKAP